MIEMKIRRSNSSYLLIAGIIGLMIGGSWLIYSVFSATFKSQIEERQAKNILPLSGILNKEVISNLKTRRSFTNEEISRVESVDYEVSVEDYKPINVSKLGSVNVASNEADAVSEDGEPKNL